MKHKNKGFIPSMRLTLYIPINTPYGALKGVVMQLLGYCILAYWRHLGFAKHE
jgi:hypothetical protein